MSSYKISILFTRQHSLACSIMCLITRGKYTHASISLNDDYCFYSFNFKGFSTEHPSHRTLFRNKKESLCLKFQVDKDTYQNLEEYINFIKRHKSQYKYNYSGAVAALLHIPMKKEDSYFCSQFVGMLLSNLKDIQWKHDPQSYLPTSLANELMKQECIDDILVDVV